MTIRQHVGLIIMGLMLVAFVTGCAHEPPQNAPTKPGRVALHADCVVPIELELRDKRGAQKRCDELGAKTDEGRELDRKKDRWRGCLRVAQGKPNTAVITDNDENIVHEIRHLLEHYCRKYIGI